MGALAGEYRVIVSRRDAFGAAAVGAVALAIYLRTLAPGLVAVVDTPMFQFIGRVLGVPHNPGYPLYVLLTHAFSYVPVGSLAYRINLFSALCGALAVALLFLVSRELRCRTVISLAGALGFAFGHIFWSQSIIAEVYTLNAALVAALLLLLLLWRRTQREGFFFAAVAAFAIGLGNHTTIVGFAPGLAAFALITNRRFALRLRTILISAALVAVGVLQYAFIILRSRQAGAYVESPATTVPELLRVMAGAQFEDRLFSFEWRAVVLERLPWVVKRVLAPELTVPGLLLAGVGAAWLVRRRLPEAVLLLLGGGAIVAFAANYNVVDTPVFLIPAILVLWLCAAVGMEQLAGLARVGGRTQGVALAALALPVWLLAGNFAITDRSHDTDAAAQLDGLFDALPDPAALVHEDFIVDRMVMFKLLGEGAARGRRIELARRDGGQLRTLQREGVSVHAFPRSARRLRYEGLHFGYGPLRVTGGDMSRLLGRLPEGSVVAVAAPARDAERVGGVNPSWLDTIDAAAAVADTTPGHLVVAGVIGARRRALVRTSDEEARITFQFGELVGGAAVPAEYSIELRSGSSEAGIRWGGRDLVRTPDGAAVAVWNAEGRLDHAFVLDRADDYRVPLKAGPLSVYPLRGLWSSQSVGSDEWTDLRGSVRTGSAMLRVPAGGTLVLHCGADRPLAPRAVDRSSNAVRVEVTSVDEGGPDGRWKVTHLYKIEIASPSAAGSVLLALGGVPTHAAARMTQAAAPAAAFSVDTVGLLRTPDRSSHALLMARDDQAQLIGAGWSPVDADAVTPFRWMTAPEGRFVLPLAGNNLATIRIQALYQQQTGDAGVSLHLNDATLPRQPLRSGWNTYEWAVAPGLLRHGTNQASIAVDRVLPDRALAVADVRVIHGR